MAASDIRDGVVPDHPTTGGLETPATSRNPENLWIRRPDLFSLGHGDWMHEEIASSRSGLTDLIVRGRNLAEDLVLLAAGEETLWWGDTGRPAPFPEDFLDPGAGWTANQNTGDQSATDDPENPPF